MSARPNTGPTLTVTCLLLSALWSVGRVTGKTLDNLWDTHNLVNCDRNVDYCSSEPGGGGSEANPRIALVGCTDSRQGICRHRCPLGHPPLRYKTKEGRRCAAVCPSGYFVGMHHEGDQVCRRHSSSCPEGEHLILPGRSWHDTICGEPEDFDLQTAGGPLQRTDYPSGFLNALNTLALDWIPALSEGDMKELCKVRPKELRLRCMRSFEYWLVTSDSPAETLFKMLNKISSFETAKLMYEAVVKPFVDPLHPNPELSLVFTQTDPLWVREEPELTFGARVTVPLGAEHRYTLKMLTWYAGTRPLAVANAKGDFFSTERRYRIARGSDWNKWGSFGFFVDTADVSLVAEDFHCDLFDALRVDVTVFDEQLRTTEILRRDLHVNCLWKTEPQPACNCTRALLNYMDPGGLCSPTCISAPFAHVSKGAEGSHNDWTLEITRREPDTSLSNHGRVLYGSVSPATERFCLVTSDVFAMSPGPAREAPSAPLDVMRCDVVLVEFHVWSGEPPAGVRERGSIALAVRSPSSREVHFPTAAEDTLNTVIRQGWGGKVGVKLSFSSSSGRTSPDREELAAVLDWMSTLRWPLDRAPRVAVVDVNVDTMRSADFAAISKLYGSKVEVIPGLSADAVAEVMRTRMRTEYVHWKCGHRVLCSRLNKIHGERGEILYDKAVDGPVSECPAVAQPSPGKCTACRDVAGDVAVSCPVRHPQPDDAEDDTGGKLHFERHTPSRSLGDTRSYPLAPEQERAEMTLRELGLLVWSRGAFLNVDTVSAFPRNETGCERVRPGRWTVGEYDPEDPYAIRIPRDEQYPERTGLSVFEELCWRSNNRAGIVVSIPSADYVAGVGCKRGRLFNRHVEIRDPADVSRHRYSMRELAGVVSDMAKWGVCRYSLGYLDYTFGNPDGAATFTKLSRSINSAAADVRTLHYRYTRTSTFGDGGYSYARVDGVYKLEGGMFFQRVAEGTPLTKSFVSVPGVPNLRLGLSSDMNVGAPMPVSELMLQDTAERVKAVPRGARVVDLNTGTGTVAFADSDRGRICVHSPSTVARHDVLRLPPSGLRSEGWVEGCESYINGTEHRARVAVPVPVTADSKEAILRSMSDWSRWLGTPTLTREEQDWLSGASPHRDSPGLRPTSILDSMHLMSITLECIRGSGSCTELADYADNGWPRGGAWYPIAISTVSESEDEVSVRMIISANHGMIRVKTPCHLKQFSFGSEPQSFPPPEPGYYTRAHRSLISQVKTYVTNLGSLASGIVRPLAMLYCPEGDRRPSSEAFTSEAYLRKTRGCVSATNDSLRDARDSFSALGSLIEGNEKTASSTAKRVALFSARTSALCLIATMLAVLINVTLIGVLCYASCEGSRYRQRRYRKLR